MANNAKNNAKHSSENITKIVTIGASVAAIAGAAYFLLGPKAKKHQKQLKAWAIKMRGDVIEKLESAHEVSESVYHEIIDSVAKEYVKGKKASRDEIDDLSKDLKKHWKTISKSARAAKDDITKSASRVVKSAKENLK